MLLPKLPRTKHNATELGVYDCVTAKLLLLSPLRVAALETCCHLHVQWDVA